MESQQVLYFTQAVEGFVEYFNRNYLHSAIGYRTPNEFEKQWFKENQETLSATAWLTGSSTKFCLDLEIKTEEVLERGTWTVGNPTENAVADWAASDSGVWSRLSGRWKTNHPGNYRIGAVETTWRPQTNADEARLQHKNSGGAVERKTGGDSPSFSRTSWGIRDKLLIFYSSVFNAIREFEMVAYL